ncbi:PREDICTED: uncharacterized protein LOC109167837 [Ipomoea nil]|uniref:uncharacterized protein LOC109167837 n=1 Tax=Ipomoea nil TaxID=35883 RepID=UPI000900EE69|nr:PREDICTED: uncharacterized protein LOC109167837 [Ipomoea nil]
MSPRQRTAVFEDVGEVVKRYRLVGSSSASGVIERWIRSGTSTRVSSSAATLPVLRDVREYGSIEVHHPAVGSSQERVLTLNEVRTGDSDVVVGTFLVQSVPATVLFDSGASNSFISPGLVKKLGLSGGAGVRFNVKVASGEVRVCDRLFEGIKIYIKGEEFPSDLIQYDLDGMDVVLGMDWLGRFRAQILCKDQKVVLRGPSGKRVSYRGKMEEPGIKLVSMVKMKRYMDKGNDVYLCSVENLEAKEEVAQSIPVVGEFLDVFPEEIPGMPPAREVEFSVDLMPGTAPISKAPYRLAPPKMQELKAQLQELLDKGYIRPSASPWGAPVLFVKTTGS